MVASLPKKNADRPSARMMMVVSDRLSAALTCTVLVTSYLHGKEEAGRRRKGPAREKLRARAQWQTATFPRAGMAPATADLMRALRVRKGPITRPTPLSEALPRACDYSLSPPYQLLPPIGSGLVWPGIYKAPLTPQTRQMLLQLLGKLQSCSSGPT